MTPARVSKAIFFGAIFLRFANRAAQREPFPHISASLPSELKKRHLKFAFFFDDGGTITISPSAPTERFRWQTCFARELRFLPLSMFLRLSIRIKSLPLPWILWNGIFFMLIQQ